MDKEIESRLERIEAYTLLAAKNVLNVNEVALLIGRSPKTIRNRMDEIPHYTGPEGIRFIRSEIEEWMCAVQHTPIAIN